MSLLGSLFYDAKKEEQQKTTDLYDSAHALYNSTGLANHGERIGELGYEITAEAFLANERSTENAIFDALNGFVCDILFASSLYFFLDPHARNSFDDGLEQATHMREIMRMKKSLYRNGHANHEKVMHTASLFVDDILDCLPVSAFLPHNHDGQTFNVPILDFVDNPPTVIHECIGTFFTDAITETRLFESIRHQLNQNIDYASGNIKATDNKPTLLPKDLAGKKSNAEIAELYFRGTFLLDVFTLTVPFTIPHEARFEHAHVVGGSGHGKTQCLQHIIYSDVIRAREGKGGFCVIDSQGDLISKILRLAEFSPEHEKSLADNVVLLDPNDIEYPLALNMFDMRLDRIKGFSRVEQEKILNGTIELYEYIFSSLLGAELTQKQGVIFKYLARAMMAIPNATIQTLREFIEDGKPYRKYVASCGKMTEHFFDTQFFTSTYNDTRKQILTRLWGILSNPVFERMFSAPKNNVDMFGAMNDGKIVLINTAKDLLKTEGCSIFGRFFIAMIAQAALSRSAIAESKRTPFFVFIDEAQDYFDDKIEDLLNQARKYRVGLTLAHQNLDQLDTKLRASIIASTSIKMVGGVSAKDASIFSKNMHCNEATLLSAKKKEKHTEFMCYIRNTTPQPVKLSVPLGMMERLPTSSPQAYNALIERNRQRVSFTVGDAPESVTIPIDGGLQEQTNPPPPETLPPDNPDTAERPSKAVDIFAGDDEPLENIDPFVIKKRAVRNRPPPS